MSAQIHTFIHHDPHIHHPSLHHPHPHRNLSHQQRDHLGGWNGLLWTDYLNADSSAALRDLKAEYEEETSMLSDSSEEEEMAEREHEHEHDYCTTHNHPARPLSPPLLPRKKLEDEHEDHDYCTLHEHPARPLSPPLLPRVKVEPHEHDYCTEHEHPSRPLSPPLLPRARVEVHKEEHPDYCTLHDHPARPLSPPLVPRSMPVAAEEEHPRFTLVTLEEHHDYCTLHEHPEHPLSPAPMPRSQEPTKTPSEDAESEASISHYEDWIEEAMSAPASPPVHNYCTLHEHPERPLSPPLLHRTPALKGSESPNLKPQTEEEQEHAGISHYEDWIDEFRLDRTVEQSEDSVEQTAARRALMDEANDLIDEANEIEEDMWSDAPETPSSEHSRIFDDLDDVEPGILAGSYNRRCSTGAMEDIEEACCSCKNEECSAAYLAKELKTDGLRLRPVLKKSAKVPMGAW